MILVSPSRMAIVNFPSKSVMEPMDYEPLTCTVAPGSGPPMSSLTTPLTILPCEKTNSGNTKSVKISFFIDCNFESKFIQINYVIFTTFELFIKTYVSLVKN